MCSSIRFLLYDVLSAFLVHNSLHPVRAFCRGEEVIHEERGRRTQQIPRTRARLKVFRLPSQPQGYRVTSETERGTSFCLGPWYC